eukprot:tig00000949_g5757.t1
MTGGGASNSGWNIGTYLGHRLEEIGIKTWFGVPGDYNLVLMDQFLKNKNLEMVNCCNELNAGYAADGYARVHGIACVVVTFSVGGLSVVNAVAGAYSDHLPLIVISGGPNSNDFQTNRILHHTIGLPDCNQQYRIFREVTRDLVQISTAVDATIFIDKAIESALKSKRPVYIEISCNLSAVPCAAPNPLMKPGPSKSVPTSLGAALEAACKIWNAAAKPVFVVGSKVRPASAFDACVKFATKAGCGTAIMPNAKGMFPESHASFMGTYWGMASSPFVCETVESCDCYLFAGPVFNDYTTVGYSILIKKEKMIRAGRNSVKLPTGEVFNNVAMAEFLAAFADKCKPNGASLAAYKRLYSAPADPVLAAPGSPLTTKQLLRNIQGILTPNHAVVVETGDSWFHGQRLRLPDGCLYEFQMQYGSIGWSVGAVLGIAAAIRDKQMGKRTVAMIGDGSFQMTFQEVSTMIRFGLDPIIFLLNNRGYTIEVEIHDGPYNNIKNWDYAKLMETFNAEEGNGWGVRVDTEEQLVEAIAKAVGHKGAVLIECTLDRDDCTKELLEWGSRVASANGRPDRAFENF